MPSAAYSLHLQDDHSRAMHDMSNVLVIIPTFNEASTIIGLCQRILQEYSNADILVVDDCSPDGTGDIVRQCAAIEPRIHLLSRRGPRGLGAAYMAGFRWALRRKYAFVIQMDADGSHDPRCISQMMEEAARHDLVIGSRYSLGGSTTGWPMRRKLVSRVANSYARTLLRSAIADLTSGYRCWRRELLERIDFAALRCNGYAFQVEMGYLAGLAGARIREVPITFKEAKNGVAKMTPLAARVAAVHTGRLAWDRLWGRPHGALLATKDPSESSRCRAAPLSSASHRVLIMCLGGIGDTVLSFPMLRQLREQLPDSHLTALVMWPQAADLLKDLRLLDEVVQHNFQTEGALSSLRKLLSLRLRKFGLSVIAYPANRWEFNLACWLIHARQRLGHIYSGENRVLGLSWLLTDTVSQDSCEHNSDANLKLIARLTGASLPLSPEAFTLGALPNKAVRFAQHTLENIPGPYLGIHAGSSTFKNMSAKRWPAEYFAQLCNMAHSRLGLTPLLFGGDREAELNARIARQSPGAIVVQDQSVREFAATVRYCRAVVANDSALAHVAASAGTKTLVICGPTSPMAIWRPGGNVAVVSSSRACAPCYSHSRKPIRCTQAKPFCCLHDIRPERVFDHLERILQHQPEARARTNLSKEAAGSRTSAVLWNMSRSAPIAAS